MEPNLALPIATALWFILLAALLMSVVFGLFLSYHWMRFSASPIVSLFTIIVYAGGCAVLLLTMLGAIVAL